MSNYTASLKEVIESLKLEALHLSGDYETRRLTVADVNRPALQLAGFYDYFNEARLQVIGRVETSYLETLTPDQKYQAMMTLMSYDIPGLVICHGCQPLPECLEAAEKFDRSVFITDLNTADVEGLLLGTLRRLMAPRITRHGVFVEIYGEGVFITGESGMGKSETALELIKRGHRLIADDAVEIKRIDNDTLIGAAPELIRYYMELRGIGVINVRHIYGMSAVKPEGAIDLVIYMEPWQEGKAYDRLGLNNETEEILGIRLPKVTIPVRPGRNLAVILELAAMNNRQKKLGYNAAETLAAEVDALADSGI